VILAATAFLNACGGGSGSGGGSSASDIQISVPPGSASASIYSIGGMATDATGNVYVTDANTIRKITGAGVVTTVAGQPSSAGVTLGSLPGSLTNPTGIAVVPGNSGTKLAVMDEYSVLSITLE
jgi:hypothetical protein